MTLTLPLPRRTCLFALALLALGTDLFGQIDPVPRRLIQLGYNQPLQGKSPIAAYGFYYHNQPHFLTTNLTLRLAIAPIYLDSELGISQALGPNTDLAIGFSGGGFAHTYSEIRGGKYLEAESFVGHGGEVSGSIYHLMNPGRLVPLWAVIRNSLAYKTYEREGDTADLFVIPDDRLAYHLRTGLRWGGQEPTLTAPLAMELSGWYEGRFRAEPERYGFAGDREVENASHLFWARALLKYSFDPDVNRFFSVSLTGGASVDADRLTAYRLGGVLPFATEFPLNIPGYYFQEISTEAFGLLNAQVSAPIDPFQGLSISGYGAAGLVDYLDGLEQSGEWHSGIGLGFTYTSPSQTWHISLLYGHAFDAFRNGKRGADSVGLLFQYDFDAKERGADPFFEPGVNPYKSRGGERLLF